MTGDSAGRAAERYWRTHGTLRSKTAPPLRPGKISIVWSTLGGIQHYKARGWAVVEGVLSEKSRRSCAKSLLVACAYARLSLHAGKKPLEDFAPREDDQLLGGGAQPAPGMIPSRATPLPHRR